MIQMVQHQLYRCLDSERRHQYLTRLRQMHRRANVLTPLVEVFLCALCSLAYVACPFSFSLCVLSDDVGDGGNNVATTLINQQNKSLTSPFDPSSLVKKFGVITSTITNSLPDLS